MKTRLSGKVLVLTGAGGGIGRAVAEKLAGHGMKAVLLGGRNGKKLDETRAAVEKSAPCLVLPGDLTDPDFIASGVAEALRTFGGIDVLVNNAGAAQSTPFEEVSLAEFDRLMAVNVRAPFCLTQACLPHLRKSAEIGRAHV